VDSLTIFRFVLPFIGIGIFALAAKLIKPPKKILLLTLKLCWITYALCFLFDVIGTHYGFWHYTMDHLIFGLPLDIYLTISLVYGGALLLLYWWLRSYHTKWVTLFIIILPFYGLLRDYLGQKATGSTFLVWDNPYWWIPDFFAYAIALWSVIYVFKKMAFK
jgi:hypothetical protein